MARRAFLFDLDGTLWDSHPWYAKVASSDEPERVQAVLGSLQSGRPAATVLRACGLTGATFERACRLDGDALRLYPGVRETLATLARRSAPTAVVTNLPAWIAGPMLRATGIDRFFETVVYYARHRRPKPAPDSLVAAITELGLSVDAGGVWYVGDAEGDSQAAKAAGVQFAWVSYGYGKAPPHHDSVVSSFEQVLDL